MAMDQHVGSPVEIPPEGEDRRHVRRLRRHQHRAVLVRAGAEAIVEMQGGAAVDAVAPEGGRLGRAGIEERQDMADSRFPMARQFLQATDGMEREGGFGRGHGFS